MTTALDPPQYVCPVHHFDITPLVESAVLASHSVSTLADGANGFGLRAQRGSREFRVVVTCPGAAADKPHRLVESGRRLET